MIQTTVDHEAVDPGGESRFAAEFADAGKQFEEGVLGQVHGDRFVAGEAQGDRVDPVFVCLEERAKGIPLTALTGFDEFPIRPFQHHSRKYAYLLFDDYGLIFIPCF